MIGRGARAGLAALSAGLLLLAVAPQAGAANNPDPNPSCQAASCSVGLAQFIRLSGDVGNNGHVTVNVPPPPCLWEPIGNQITGSQQIIQEFGTITQQDSLYGVFQSVQQAKKLLKNGTPVGTWYELPINPADTPAEEQECLAEPLFFFAQPGVVPPMPPIPPVILARYAFNHMTIPTPDVTVSPNGKGYVNEATYAWAHWAPSKSTGTEDYRIIATLGAQVASVWAQPESVSVAVNGPGTPYENCGTGGSKYPRGHAPATTPGQAPDCGVLWNGASTGATVTVSVTWRVTWAADVLDGPGPNFLATITTTGTSGPLNIYQIQSING
jgi:hypothetical protein